MNHAFGDRLHSFCKSCYLWNKRTEAKGPDFLYSCDLFILLITANLIKFTDKSIVKIFDPLKDTFNS